VAAIQGSPGATGGSQKRKETRIGNRLKQLGTTPRKPMWNNITCSLPRRKIQRMSRGLVLR
jgi:hypothetical protein